jgi:hypothetical protein
MSGRGGSTEQILPSIIGLLIHNYPGAAGLYTARTWTQASRKGKGYSLGSPNAQGPPTLRSFPMMIGLWKEGRRATLLQKIIQGPTLPISEEGRKSL